MNKKLTRDEIAIIHKALIARIPSYAWSELDDLVNLSYTAISASDQTEAKDTRITELESERDNHKSLFASLLGMQAWISDLEMKQFFQSTVNEGLKDWKLTAAQLNKSELEKERDELQAKHNEAAALLLPIIEWGQDPENCLPLNSSCTAECLKRAKERDQAFDLLEAGFNGEDLNGPYEEWEAKVKTILSTRKNKKP